MADDANSLIREYETLYSDQSNWRSLWNTIAQYVMPAHDSFIGDQTEGVIRTSRIFDSSAITANERFAAIMESLLTPRSQQWHGLTPADAELKENSEVTAYCEAVRDILFTERYRPMANYASTADECYMSLGAFGNTAMYIDELAGHQVLYRSIPMSEVVWSLSASGMVDSVYRKFKWSARQIIQRWGAAKAGEKVRAAFEKQPFTEFEIIHVCKPNPERTAGAMGAKGMKHASWYMIYDQRQMLEVGGYRTFPYAIGRYRMAPREHYGRSPGSVALPAIRTLNEQKKTLLRAAQKAVDPPLLLQDEGVLTPPNLRAGALNYGMLGSDGTKLVEPLMSGAKIEIGMEMMQAEGQAVKDSFLTSVFDILEQHPDMTATQAALIAQQKGMLITPAMGRQQSEFLGPQIARELDLHQRAGRLPPMPEALLAAGGQLRVEYTSPLAKVVRQDEAMTIMSTLQGVLQIAPTKPEVLDLYDWDGLTRRFSECSGFPLSLLLDQGKVDQLRQQRAQQQQEQQATEAAPDLSTAALNVAKAHQALTQTPGQ